MKRSFQELKRLAFLIRSDVLEMTLRAGVNGGHLGGGLSCADILAVLYGEVLNICAEDPLDTNRDRFLLSKGHVALAHYAALAETGFFDREELLQFEVSGGTYPTHEIADPQKGIEISSGSLGYGLSVGVGCALNAKIKGLQYKTYVLLGDGECNEGSVWEACMAAARFELGNLIAVVDVNGQSLDGHIDRIMPIHDFKEVFSGFGWNVKEVDGHDFGQLLAAFAAEDCGKPTVILAHTVKCKGVPSIEGREGWHHARLMQEQYESFLGELKESYDGI